MDRPTRRSSAASNNGSAASNGAMGGSSRRRRREAEGPGVNRNGGSVSASASDGADTDSSAKQLDVGTRRKPSTRGKGWGESNGRRTRRSGEDEAAEGVNAATTKEMGDGVAAKVQDELDDGDSVEVTDGEDALTETAESSGHTTDKNDATEDAIEDDDDEKAMATRAPPTHGYSMRPKRERSHSVVSTTSDTSSIASEHNDDGHQELHVEKLQELEKKKKMVEDGTLAEYCRRVAEFKEERNRLLQTAEWHKNLQVKNTQDLYGFEVQRAHNIWEDNKNNLKSTMLEKTDLLLAKLKRELADLNRSGELPKYIQRARTVVKKKAFVAAIEPSENSSTKQPPQVSVVLKRRKISAPVPDNVVRLPLDDIATDISAIARARDGAAQKLHTGLEAPRLELKVERRRLHCGKYVFEEGDEVVVTSAVLKEDYIGVLSSVHNDELYVRLSTGEKVRVHVEHIALRRCELRPFLRGSAGITSLQSTGWVECEPF